MKIMKFLLFELLIFISQSGFTQNVFHAKIIDASSREPLTGASAMLKGTDLGASSGVNGLVEINNIPNGVHEIVFSFISYQTKTSSFVFPLSNADTIEVGLSPSETNLDEIIITSTRSSRSIDD